MEQRAARRVKPAGRPDEEPPSTRLQRVPVRGQLGDIVSFGRSVPLRNRQRLLSPMPGSVPAKDPPGGEKGDKARASQARLRRGGLPSGPAARQKQHVVHLCYTGHHEREIKAQLGDFWAESASLGSCLTRKNPQKTARLHFWLGSL